MVSFEGLLLARGIFCWQELPRWKLVLEIIKLCVSVVNDCIPFLKNYLPITVVGSHMWREYELRIPAKAGTKFCLDMWTVIRVEKKQILLANLTETVAFVCCKYHKIHGTKQLYAVPGLLICLIPLDWWLHCSFKKFVFTSFLYFPRLNTSLWKYVAWIHSFIRHP